MGNSSTNIKSKATLKEYSSSSTNIIMYPDFSQGLHMWQPNCNGCHAFVVSSESDYPEAFEFMLSCRFAVVKNNITNRVSAGSTYYVCAWVGILSAYHRVAAHVEGTFVLSTVPHRVKFYLEGPSPEIDLLIRSVLVSSLKDDNPWFDDGLNNWSGRGCKIVLHESMEDGKVLPIFGKSFVATENRTKNYYGIQQEITGRVQPKLAHKVVAIVRIPSGNSNICSANVKATLWDYTAGIGEQYIRIASAQATIHDWVQLEGTIILINSCPKMVIIYLEGPDPGTDILLDNLVVKLAPKSLQSPPNLSDDTDGWFPKGNCTLTVVGNGSPRVLPSMVRDYLGPHEPLSGRYILVTNRTQTRMGPSQMITHKLKPYLTYQVSAWVRIGNGAIRSQNINVVLDVDVQPINGGQVDINDSKWHEISGSFRIENQPTKAMVYVQGPDIGVDFMVSELQIFAFAKSDPGSLAGTFVKIKQTQNSFPFGTCVYRSNLTHKEFLDFFSKNFNWAVFENELKWYWTEPEQGSFSYKDAEDLMNLYTTHNIQLRGNCIFSEVQSWVRSLSNDDMKSAIQNRLTSLLTQCKGKFKYYDVSNEMLHGSFYQDRLGKDIRAKIFKTANKIDPSATLFVNDFNIEKCCEKYIEQILDLQERGDPVGGIGIQGHMDSPIGHIVSSTLNKLGTLGLPIWFTEIDVSLNNEYVRADDLEVMLREAFAHPTVDGIMLWGFWELFMSRDNAHLVNAEGDVNEAAQGHVNKQDEFEFRGFHGSYEVEIVTLSKKKLGKTFVGDQG
ncbi:hypothetical protein ACJIZ3_008481 [Penstemon smallii]|uniref:GH10 domain-containing protein n=1 Tax=Penstemon smallii TaxID=265156 RepID=A0ABD3TAL2_9LAMI